MNTVNKAYGCSNLAYWFVDGSCASMFLHALQGELALMVCHAAFPLLKQFLLLSLENVMFLTGWAPVTAL